MKKFWDFIFYLLNNSCLSVILAPIILLFFGILMLFTFFAPSVIGKIIFGFDNFIVLLLVDVLWAIAVFSKLQKYLDDDEPGKFLKLWCVTGLIPFFMVVFDEYNSSLPKNTASHVPPSTYSYQREYSPSYSYRDTHSGSNYRHSDSSSDIVREKTNIPYVSAPENQTIGEKSRKIFDKVNIPRETEALTPPQDDFVPENQPVAEKSEEILDKVDIPREDETISPPIDEIYLSDDLEYVTSDEQGNKYYINRSFGNYITTTSIEGTVCHAMFRKIFRNGVEVEVSEYEFNQGMVTKKKILAYEDSTIKFRNENGFREFSFSTKSGYTADGSIIIGWGTTNFAENYQWKPINDELYNALCDAAYKSAQ